jgi:hypothetical protein
MRTDRWTDMTKLIVAFRVLRTRLKNGKVKFVHVDALKAYVFEWRHSYCHSEPRH